MAHLYRSTNRKTGQPHERWKFQYRDWRGRKVTGTGERSKARSLKIAQDLEDMHRLVRQGVIPPPKESAKPRDIGKVMEEYLEWGRTRGGRGQRPWSKGHLRMRASHLAWWKEKLNLSLIQDLVGALPRVERALRSFRERGRKGKPLTGKTLQNVVESIRALARWAVQRKYLDADPFDGMAAFDTTPKTRRRALAPEEIAKLLAVAPPHRRLFYETALLTGLRVGECGALRVRDLDRERGGLVLDPAWTKNRQGGFQVLPAALFDRLVAEAEGKDSEVPLLRVNPSHAARDMDRDLKRAGIPKKTLAGKVDAHALRVTYATLLDGVGATLKERMELVRHQDPRLTMNTYTRVQDGRLREVAEQVAAAALGSGIIVAERREAVSEAQGA